MFFADTLNRNHQIPEISKLSQTIVLETAVQITSGQLLSLEFGACPAQAQHILPSISSIVREGHWTSDFYIQEYLGAFSQRGNYDFPATKNV